MKTTVIATVLTMLAAPVFAGDCATVPVEGSNYTVKADPNCVIAANKGGDPILTLVLGKVLVEAFGKDK